jgi:YhcH/YjgK/YiaL family protein
MHPNTFAVFFPGDAHAPTLAIDEVKQVKKVVIKVPV